MCGASGEQKALSASQTNFFQTLTDHYQTVFGEQQGVLSSLTDSFKPILERGPNGRGFSDAERSTLETQAGESTARGYAKAKQALGEAEAARGGNAYIPSGADDQRDAELASSAESERANLDQRITLADYDEGHRQYDAAASGLLGVAGLESPTAAAGAATGAGSAASETANEIAQEDNSVWQGVVGAIGGIAGQAVGGWAGKP